MVGRPEAREAEAREETEGREEVEPEDAELIRDESSAFRAPNSGLLKAELLAAAESE